MLTFEIRDQGCYNPFLDPRTKKENIYINIYSEEIEKIIIAVGC